MVENRILVENRIFRRKSDFVQNRILVENRNFGTIAIFWSKISDFGRKSNFWPKIEIFIEISNFGRKAKFFSQLEIWSKIEILVETRNFVQKLKFFENRNFNWNYWLLSKIQILIETRDIGRKYEPNFSRKSKFVLPGSSCRSATASIGFVYMWPSVKIGNHKWFVRNNFVRSESIIISIGRKVWLRSTSTQIHRTATKIRIVIRNRIGNFLRKLKKVLVSNLGKKCVPRFPSLKLA